jgi:hypothetical protein
MSETMNKQPKALRLAEWIERRNYTDYDVSDAAAELRRLHAENATLRAAIEQAEKQEKQEGWVLREVLFDGGEAIAHREPEKQEPGQVEFDYKHPRAQALIANDAQNRMCIDLIWRILEDPHRDFTASEYWDEIHDAVRAALIKREWQRQMMNEIVKVMDDLPKPQREWVGLTEEEREQATGWSVEHIEAALKEKNTLGRDYW